MEVDVALTLHLKEFNRKRTKNSPVIQGMSPVVIDNFNGNCDGDDRSPSATDYSLEASPWWQNTPVVAPASVRCSRQRYGKNMSGTAFCLRPLMRASPNRHWNTKELALELTGFGKVRSMAKPQLSTALSFCGNHSRELEDFGIFNRNC